MMLTASDMMIKEVVTLTADQDLATAHALSRVKGIRHLPIIDTLTGKLIAIATQKRMVAKVFNLVNLYGITALDDHEKQVNILEIAEMDCQSIHEDTLVEELVPLFLDNRHGCLPVTDDDGRLKGIITSADFVRLSANLLLHKND